MWFLIVREIRRSGNLVRGFLILTFFTIRRNLLPLSLDIVSWTLRKGMFIKHSLCSSKDDIVWHAHEAEVVVAFTDTEVDHQLRLGR